MYVNLSIKDWDVTLGMLLDQSRVFVGPVRKIHVLVDRFPNSERLKVCAALRLKDWIGYTFVTATGLQPDQVKQRRQLVVRTTRDSWDALDEIVPEDAVRLRVEVPRQHRRYSL